MEWNVLATAFMRKERHLLRFLREFGDFKGSGFRDVIIGTVENRDAFLETIESLRREHPEKVRQLSQIVPVDKTFQFAISDFREKLKEALASYLEELKNDCRFYIRVKRRGHKEELSSLEIEKEMSGFIVDALEQAGKQARINFEDPDKFIIVEIIGNRAGVGLITRAMKERCPLIRVK